MRGILCTLALSAYPYPVMYLSCSVFLSFIICIKVIKQLHKRHIGGSRNF